MLLQSVLKYWQPGELNQVSP